MFQAVRVYREPYSLFAHLAGKGMDETGVGPDDRVLVRIDPRYFRPSEVDHLVGDGGLARQELGWKPKVRSPSYPR